MTLIEASISATVHDRMIASFPSTGGELGARREPLTRDEPRAALSFASLGDMKFGDTRCAGHRELFLREMGLDSGSVRGLSLVHSRNVVLLAPGDDPETSARALGGADGIILDPESRCAGLAAAITVADCMPIWILDRDSGAFGILHSGWRGTGILARAVELLVGRYGSSPSSMSVILGPAIGRCCYKVDAPRASAFALEFGDCAIAELGGTLRLDLRAANLSLAERLGIGFLLSIDACSSCDPRLGSYRRQGPASFTRMLAVCGHSALEPNVAEGSGEG